MSRQAGVFRHENRDGRDNRKAEVVWGDTDVTAKATPAWRDMGSPPATREQRLNAVGYLTAMTRLAVAADHGPCREAQRIFNGKELAELGFTDPHPTDLSDAQKKLGLVNAVRCTASFRQVAGYKAKVAKKAYGDDRPIMVDFAQVGAAGPWVPVRLVAHTQIGPAVIELARTHVQGRLPDEVVQASR
jgi:hypothetical protein